jgi:diguanylate cyclase (GGDEF)-like protein
MILDPFERCPWPLATSGWHGTDLPNGAGGWRVTNFWKRLAREIDGGGISPRSDTTAVVENDSGWRDWKWWASRAYRMVCFGLGLILLEFYLLRLDYEIVAAALPLAILNLLIALHSVAFPSFGRISFHFILTFANLLLFGPGVAALSASLGVFGHHLFVRRHPLSLSLFQMGRVILAVAASGWTFAALGGRWGWPNLGWAMVISSAAAYLIVGFILEVLPSLWWSAISLEDRGRTLMRQTLTVAIFTPASVSIFYIYFPYGTDGVLLFLVPVAAFILALELYARSSALSHSLSTIQEISRKISTILDPDRLAGEALRSIGEIIPYRWGAVWMRDAVTARLTARHCLGAGGEDRPLPQDTPEVVAMAARGDRILDDTVPGSRYDDMIDGSTWIHLLAVPIASRGEVFGVLGLASASSKGFTTQQRRWMDTLAGNMAIAMQNAILYQQREREAVRDGLTHLYNHRFLQERLIQEIERYKRHGRFFSLIILDIDHFKRYNDTFGHPEGDRLLIALAGILRNSVRQVDFVARYGGEEFAIVLPECPKDKAVQVAERVRRNVEDFQNAHQDHYNLTISAGVSSFPADGDDKEQIFEQADQALYRAKAGGRNKVCS